MALPRHHDNGRRRLGRVRATCLQSCFVALGPAPRTHCQPKREWPKERVRLFGVRHFSPKEISIALTRQANVQRGVSVTLWLKSPSLSVSADHNPETARLQEVENVFQMTCRFLRVTHLPALSQPRDLHHRRRPVGIKHAFSYCTNSLIPEL